MTVGRVFSPALTRLLEIIKMNAPSKIYAPERRDLLVFVAGIFFPLYFMADLILLMYRSPKQDSFLFALIGMAAVLVAVQVGLVFRYRSLANHKLILSPDGLYYEPFSRKFGVDCIPWPELHMCYPKVPSQGPHSLIVHLKPGAFRDTLMESYPGKFDGVFEIETSFLKSGHKVYQDVSDGIYGRLFKSSDRPGNGTTPRST